jgi:hypothetical protein
MNSNFSGYESVLQDAWDTLYQANHLAVSYRHRATQLTQWKRQRDFISLGVAPGLLCATFVWENVPLRTILYIISGLCSVASWVWVIFGFSYNWDNQLRLSLDTPPKFSSIVSDIKENIEIFQQSQQSKNTDIAEESYKKLKNLIDKFRESKTELEREQVLVSSWMNLMGQQNTMQLYHQNKCGSCYQNWKPGSVVFKSDEAKKFLQEAEKRKREDFCKFCGQKLPKPPY